MRLYRLALASFMLASPCLFASEMESRLDLEWSLEARSFLQSASFPEQENGGISFSIQPEWLGEWDRGDFSVTFTPFARLDSMDEERTHFDVRELYWQGIFESLEVRLGVSKVFWGKTELLHLVDIVNQSDSVENLDGEDKLGQPMLRLAWSQGPLIFQGYVLPYFRERTFAGIDGRLRPPLVVNTDMAQYQSSDKQQHLDYALRVQGYADALDYGISWFKGTARNPQLIAGGFVNTAQGPQPTELLPFYGQLEQLSVDAQYTVGSWLLKFEAAKRDQGVFVQAPGQMPQLVDREYSAATGGFEYTQYGVLGSVADAGYLVEYLWDERDEQADSGFQNDLFLATRIAANDVKDSALLAGVVIDLDNGSRFISLEASRRLNGNSKLSIEARLFNNIASDDQVFLPVSRDDYLQLEYTHYL
ncbi:MAG: hypothetical protein ACSHXK_03245 [Oceanococcus sp.]